MKILNLLPVIALSIVFAACGGQSGDGSRASCAGSYSGTYTGADSGTTSATLQPNGDLVVTFVSSSNNDGIEGVGNVTEAGDISGSSQGVTISGTFEFTGCTASGSWSSLLGGGSWQLD